MKARLYHQLALLLIPFSATSQSTPVSLRSDVGVQLVMNVKEKCARVAKDPVSGNLFYITSVGNVYEIKNLASTPYDTLLYTSASHGIDFLQGIAFIDSAMILTGNHPVDSTLNIGYVKKAVLQPSGTRRWDTIAYTAAYAQSYTWYDHGVSGIAVGSRTDHGEEQNNYGMFPGMREVPLTSAIFRIPANSVNLFLPNDSALLAPYLYADGVRNSFDLAFDSHSNLFATENSGDRDDPDELNWIRQGRNYGFPWKMGGDNNPQQFPGYVACNDSLLNQHCNCYSHNYYYNDSAFPSCAGITFTAPIKNLGPDADEYREPSGHVNDGSVSGNYVSSFTPHRCPLGLSFDKNNILAGDLKGDAFLVCFTIGADSTGLDIYGNIGAICDAGEDLLHVELNPDSTGEFQMHVTRMVTGFSNPVDTYMDGNILYVIEYNNTGNGRLFKVTLPLDETGITRENNSKGISIFPNPTTGKFNLDFNKKIGTARIGVYDLLGNCVMSTSPGSTASPTSATQSTEIDLSSKAKGIYFLKVETERSLDKLRTTEVRKIVVQ